MRLSCNGCRVLRKGCSVNCNIRPCLQWIKSPEAQATATLFLAKFYGRAGLINLINAGPDHLRPYIFRSLLHEACGRIVNPVHGSAGLWSTGSWQLCQATVEAVLNGSPISQASIEPTVDSGCPLFKTCDIRHVSKQEKESAQDPQKVKKRSGFKRSAAKAKPKKKKPAVLMTESSGYSASHSDAPSVETVEDTLAKPVGPENVGLELTLGRSLSHDFKAQKVEIVKMREKVDGSDADTWKGALTLGLIYQECAREFVL